MDFASGSAFQLPHLSPCSSQAMANLRHGSGADSLRLAALIRRRRLGVKGAGGLPGLSRRPGALREAAKQLSTGGCGYLWIMGRFWYQST